MKTTALRKAYDIAARAGLNPMAQRLYILESQARASNECERVACEVALRVLGFYHPWLLGRPIDREEREELS